MQQGGTPAFSPAWHTPGKPAPGAQPADVPDVVPTVVLEVPPLALPVELFPWDVPPVVALPAVTVDAAPAVAVGPTVVLEVPRLVPPVEVLPWVVPPVVPVRPPAEPPVVAPVAVPLLAACGSGGAAKHPSKDEAAQSPIKVRRAELPVH